MVTPYWLSLHAKRKKRAHLSSNVHYMYELLYVDLKETSEKKGVRLKKDTNNRK